VTARLICRTLKINSATLYRWFDSKDDLYIYLMKTLLDKETFPENLVWDMDDFIVQKIRTGECYTDNERKFLVSWQHIPENVLAKMVFEGVLFDDAPIRYNLLRMQQAGEVRPDLNIDLTVYIYSTLSYNIQRFINERGIEDPEEVKNIQHFVYYDLLRLGIKGQNAENENEKSVGD
jgi:AcrR family transcriptional regulator